MTLPHFSQIVCAVPAAIFLLGGSGPAARPAAPAVPPPVATIAPEPDCTEPDSGGHDCGEYGQAAGEPAQCADDDDRTERVAGGGAGAWIVDADGAGGWGF